MADVARERGQLLLVTAIGIAVLLVTLAIVVNTVIYTENLATRSSEIAGGSEAISYRDAARQGIGGVVTYVNAHNDTNHDDLQENLTDGVRDWRSAAAGLYAGSSVGANVSLASTTNGTRIRQDNAGRDFTNRTGTAIDWTLVTNVNRTRRFRIDVTASGSELGDFGSGNGFRVVVDDGSETWRLNVTDDGGSTVIGINDTDGEHANCTSTTTEPWINLTAGTVAGEECDALRFAEGIGTPYSIRFENGDEVTGTYELIVTNRSLGKNPSPDFNGDGGGSPFAVPAVYSADVAIVYQTPRLYYNTTVRAAPGEP